MSLELEKITTRAETSPALDTVIVCHPERLVAAATAAVLRNTGTARATMTVPTLTRLLSNLHHGVEAALVFDVVKENMADLFEALRHRGQSTPVLIVADKPTPTRAARVLEWGAAGMVASDCSVECLCESIAQAVRGNAVLPSGQRHEVLEALRRRRLDRYHAQQQLAGLSHAERLVLRSLADGSPVSDIAVRMSVSPHTVRSYVHTLGTKLGMHGQLRIAATGRALLTAARSANHEPPLYSAEKEGVAAG